MIKTPNILEGNYPYKKGLEPLDNEKLSLCPFIESKYLVFSSNKESFFLTILPEKLKVFDVLFNFSAKEQMLLELYQEQGITEFNSKKLVLMTRLINNTDTPKKKKTKKKTVKKTEKKIDE